MTANSITEKRIDTLLVANRGEIACRIMRTASAMGIRTVAVYSDADRDSQHVQLADSAYHIGGSAAASSYLDTDKVLQAAKHSGADAIHPGYGFLSENAGFAKACEQAGIIFIGPPASAIEAMGSKSAAKALMSEAGVPLVPGYHGDDQSPERLKQSADEMGYPVLLKASAGGGGKGMRPVHEAGEFDEALAAAKRESAKSFGDDHMLVEKLIQKPRHVEIQVFFDQHGNGVYLFERDCSIQRRHQKVIEEAPAPGMDEDLRRAMGEAAVRAAAAIDYVGAGTVEFLLDADRHFYFMEMNTRLQVEHPVTEMITGEDLVAWQINVAQGQKLPKEQSQLQCNGHAFEARIYAEAPYQDFLPQTGKLLCHRPPQNHAHCRVDGGVTEGDSVSVHYDPMISKLIVWGSDRNQALRRLSEALSHYRIGGLTTNREFLLALSRHPAMIAGDVHTGFIEQHDDCLQPLSAPQHFKALAAMAMILRQIQRSHAFAERSAEPDSPWHDALTWRVNQPGQHSFSIGIDDDIIDVKARALNQSGQASFAIEMDDERYQVSGQWDGDRLVAVVDGVRHNAWLAELDEGLLLQVDGFAKTLMPHVPGLEDDDGHAAADDFTAPMNGTIVSHGVQAGDSVSAGDVLLIMEAMKMEHTIRAPVDGVVKAFHFQAGDLVDGGAQLLDFEESDS